MEAENDKNHRENDEIENAAQSETPKEPETTKTDNIEGLNNNNNKNNEDVTELNSEEVPPPDLDKASEEIDYFISDLLKTRKADHPEPPDVPEVFDHFAFLVEANIANYDPIQQSEDQSVIFLKSVDRVSQLTKLFDEFPSEPKYSLASNCVSGILHRAMCHLEDEFRNVLEDPKFIHSLDHNQEPQDPETQSDLPSADELKSVGENNFPGYSEKPLSNLRTFWKAMTKAGYEAECYQTYIVSRRTILEETLHKLGFEKLSQDEIQKMQWEPLEGEIVSWNKTFKAFLSLHFPNERKLSKAVFTDDKSLSDSLFSSIALSMTIQLLNFAEAVAITKPSSQKLFKFIDIYETLCNAISAMDGLFPEETANDLKFKASLIRTKLGEAVVSIFSELEISIKADMGKNNVPGGAVHPLTRYTLNYLKYACEYKDTLEQIFKEHQKGDQSDNPMAGIKLPLAEEINKVMDLLDANLESKSRLYKDNALSSIFMMNNGRYILQKIKGSVEISNLMGDTWSRKRSSDLRNFHKAYQRETWNRLLSCLSTEGLTVNGKVMKPVLKEKFKSFNAMFDEIHKTQSGWVVSDEQLQSER